MASRERTDKSFTRQMLRPSFLSWVPGWANWSIWATKKLSLPARVRILSMNFPGLLGEPG